MITTFKLITIFGTGDAKSLSTGISEALITTEFGLIVAIPSLDFSRPAFPKGKRSARQHGKNRHRIHQRTTRKNLIHPQYHEKQKVARAQVTIRTISTSHR